MNEPNAVRWVGVCAGGYLAAAAVYLGNAGALAGVREGGLGLGVVMGLIGSGCAATAAVLLIGGSWAPLRGSVVLAAGLLAIHLVGLVRLGFMGPVAEAALHRSLQWQLGATFVLLWSCVLGLALRMNASLRPRGPRGGAPINLHKSLPGRSSRGWLVPIFPEPQSVSESSAEPFPRDRV